MCTGRGRIAGVARAQLTYAENPVSGAGPACTRDILRYHFLEDRDTGRSPRTRVLAVIARR